MVETYPHHPGPPTLPNHPDQQESTIELQTLKKEVTDGGDPKIPTPRQKEEIKKISIRKENFNFAALKECGVIPGFTIDKAIGIITLNPLFNFKHITTCIGHGMMNLVNFDTIVNIVNTCPYFSFEGLSQCHDIIGINIGDIPDILTYDPKFIARDIGKLNTALKALRQTLERETFIQLKKNNFNSEILVDSNGLGALVDIHGLKKIVTYNLDVDELVDIIKQEYNETYINYITLGYQTKKKELFDRLKEEDYGDDPNVKKNVVYLHTCRSTIAERKADIIKPANPIHKRPDGVSIDFNAVTGEVFGIYTDDINTLERNIGINNQSRDIIRNIIQTILDDPTLYTMLDPQNNPPSALYSIAMAIYRTQTKNETIAQAFDRIMAQRKVFEKMNLVDRDTTVFVSVYENGDVNTGFLGTSNDSLDPRAECEIAKQCGAKICLIERGNEYNLNKLAEDTNRKTTLIIKGHGTSQKINLTPMGRDILDSDNTQEYTTPEDLISIYKTRHQKRIIEQKYNETADDWMILTACYSYDFVIKFYDEWRNNSWFQLYNILPPKCIVSASQNKASLKATVAARNFFANQMAQEKTTMTGKDMITIESQNFILSGYNTGNDTGIFVPDEKFWNENKGGNGSNGEIGMTGNTKANDYDPNTTPVVSNG